MTFSALDADLLGPLFATDAMRATFADQARLAAMLHAEAALARAEARFGIVPDAKPMTRTTVENRVFMDQLRITRPTARL